MSAKISREEWIKRFQSINSIDMFDYSFIENDLKNANSKIKIKCLKCFTIFQTTPNIHYYGKSKCNNCSNNKLGLERRKTHEQFLKEVHNKWTSEFEILSLYTGAKKLIKVKHVLCGDIKEKIAETVLKHGCVICSKTYISNKNEFIKKSEAKHGKFFDYSEVNYVNNHTFITIICPLHGKFKQRPRNHTNGDGCKDCRASKGEKEIWKVLLKYNIFYESQKRFIDCRYKKPLPFDFYIPKCNLIFEFDGPQHFEITCEKLGNKVFTIEEAKKNFEFIQLKDEIKNNYCNSKDIKLVRIKYTDFNKIEEIIKRELNLGERDCE